MRLFILLFLFLFNYSSSFAASPVYWYFLGASPPPLSIVGLTKPEACSAYASSIRASFVSSDSSYCFYLPSNNPNTMRGSFNGIYLCPDKSTPNTSKPFNQQCPDRDPCQDKAGDPLEGAELSVGVASASASFPTSFCHNKCMAAGPGGYADMYGSLNGKWTAFVFGDTVAKNKYTGASCPADLGDTASTAPTQCKKGECPGQVNGVDVCVACTGLSTDTGTGSSSTTQKADGSTVTTDSKSVTTCEGGSCNTTTTTTNTTINPDGSTGGTETKTDTKTESKETFCKENPTFAACIPSGFSASACDAAPACTGDAIQCAIAQQQHKSYCDLMATPTPISELGLAAANGEAIPADHPLAQAEASPFNFSSAFTGASGGGGCPADVTVMGVTVPLSNTCEGLNALGLAALGISLIWAARVVFGG